MAARAYDVAVIGAGVFGSWTAWWLARRGLRVLVLDAYGAGNSRSSSGGESRIIRLGYGRDQLYTRWAARSLPRWRALSTEVRPPLFHSTGVLWLARDGDALSADTLDTLRAHGADHEILDRGALEERFPQIAPGSVTWGILEKDGGVLMARRAVQAVLAEAVAAGAEYRSGVVAAPIPRVTARSPAHRLQTVLMSTAEVQAGAFVFACGPWLPRLFPDELAGRIVPSRQEVFFFGAKAGDRRFGPPALPAWIDFGEELYCVPDLEGRGLKIALDRHGPPFDPDTGDRGVSGRAVREMRLLVARKLPALARAPLLETRVCQYENTSSGDFLIDRHPELENVWLAGGGSGHGFKHGPAIGEYLADRVTGSGEAEPRFGLETKATVHARRVF